MGEVWVYVFYWTWPTDSVTFNPWQPVEAWRES